MKKLKIPAIIAVAISLLSGFIKTPFMQPPGEMVGTYTNYGLPFPWLFINTSTHPIIREWAWFVLVIDIMLWIFLFWVIIRIKENKKTVKSKQTGKKEK